MKWVFSLLIIFLICGCGSVVDDTKAWLEPAPKYTDFDIKSLSAAQEAAAKRIREKTSTDFVTDWKIFEVVLPNPHFSRKLGFGPPLVRMTEFQVNQLLGQPTSYKRIDGMKCLNYEFGDFKGITTTCFTTTKDYYVFWFGSSSGTTPKEIKKPESISTANFSQTRNKKVAPVKSKKINKKKNKK